ncbi:hypothetical protein AbraIFM66950_010258 [Aspergillus brasiliensis]|nr:hypothetical protein AbraIFM66950_010258 [Aspergillus brasiliensis]
MAPFTKVPEQLSQSIADTKVEYRPVGGLVVSNPIMGCMGIGDPEWWNWVVEEERALPLLKAAFDRGINTWDTANVYSNGLSETLIGRALRKYQIPRRKVVLISKVGRVMADDGGEKDVVAFMGPLAARSKDLVNTYGLSRKSIFHQVQESLTRLGTDYLDVIMIHRYDPQTPPEETMRALHDLVTMGKVHYIGASSMWAHELVTLNSIAERNGWHKIVCMENHYNLLYREEEREMNRYCRQNNIALLPWAPLASGHLACPYDVYGQSPRTADDSENPRFSYGRSIEDREIITRVATVAIRRGWTMTEVALAWLNKRVTAPVIGFTSVKRIEEALMARGKRLSPEEEAYLEEPYRAKEIEGHC